ncbi:MAG: BamA/TamA family outer membrane protein, partial [Deltaproteobacteria bacterium]|nr:BamA/TamA family outer membrane protein [Deltaproteobacteria bacterium]
MAACVLFVGAAELCHADGSEGGDLDPNRAEWAVLPIIAGDTDIGFVFGAFVQWTRFREGIRPHERQIVTQFKMSVDEGPDGAEFPTHDHFVGADLPGLSGGRVRLAPKVFYFHEITAGYYGLGNDSRYVEPDENDDEAARRYQYAREAIGVEAQARLRIGGNWAVFSTLSATGQDVDTYAGSLLRADAESLPDEIFGMGDNTVIQVLGGVVYDSRDHEVVPTRGVFADASVRGSSGELTGADHDYGGANIAVRGFVPIAPPYAVLAVRATCDALAGDVPVYLLARAAGISTIQAPAGKNAIRGIPAGRYHGKAKALANAEMRSMFHPFSIGTQRFRWGAAAFFDTGRVWARADRASDEDGEGGGLKYGTGGGPRLQWGES